MTTGKSKTILRRCFCRVHFKTKTTRKGLWIRLATLCYPLLPSTTITKNCPSWKIRHHHILGSRSCVASQSLYCSVDWAWRTKASAKSRSDYEWFLIGDCTKQETYRQKQRTLGEMNNKFEMLLMLFLLTFSEKGLSLCLPDCSGVCSMIGPMLKFHTKY